MADVTQLLNAIQQGNPQASEDLLPLVYGELRKLAAVRLAQEKPGQTLQATALVHEAYLRLVGDHGGPRWNGRAHLCAAAAEAMRRILVERARRHGRLKRGGDYRRIELDDAAPQAATTNDELLAIDELLDDLARENAEAAEVVKLRYFAGYSLEEMAELLQLSLSTVKRRWYFARAWLYQRLPGEDPKSKISPPP